MNTPAPCNKTGRGSPPGSGPQNKKESFDLYHKGLFGNHLLFWDSYAALIADKNVTNDNVVALRTKSVPGIELPYYCRPTLVSDVSELMRRWVELGISEDLIVFNEIGPDYAITFQGEVMRDEHYFTIRYTTHKDIMRHAFAKHSAQANGLKAYMLLKYYMDAESFIQLQSLFDLYPNSIIEFSCYGVSVGCKRLNTVFWEVREY